MKIIYGTEFYCVDKKIQVVKDNYDVLETTDLKDEDLTYLDSVSFFSTKAKAILFKAADVKQIRNMPEEWIENDRVFVSYYGSIRKNEKVLQDVEVFHYNKLNEKELIHFIVTKTTGIPGFQEAKLLNKFIELSEYLTDEDVNLYSILNELNKLKILANEGITLTEQVLIDVIGSLKGGYDAFIEGDLLINQSDDAIKNAINCPKGQEIAFIGAMQHFFRVGYKMNYFQKSEVGYGKVVTPEICEKALFFLDSAFRKCVSGFPARIALMEVVFKIQEEVRNGSCI